MTDETSALSNRELKMLERMFEDEVMGHWPFQTKAKIIYRLEERGMVCGLERHYPPDRFGPIVVSGWSLTHLGRYLYCQWASLHAEDTTP
jgi:hypothetical protein